MQLGAPNNVLLLLRRARTSSYELVRELEEHGSCSPAHRARRFGASSVRSAEILPSATVAALCRRRIGYHVDQELTLRGDAQYALHAQDGALPRPALSAALHAARALFAADIAALRVGVRALARPLRWLGPNRAFRRRPILSRCSRRNVGPDNAACRSRAF